MTNQTIERTALTNLLSNEDYARIVLPFIKEDYLNLTLLVQQLDIQLLFHV